MFIRGEQSNHWHMIQRKLEKHLEYIKAFILVVLDKVYMASYKQVGLEW